MIESHVFRSNRAHVVIAASGFDQLTLRPPL
jgi:hypothetical protein